MRARRLAAGGCLILLVGTAVAGDAVWTSSGPLGGRVHDLVFDPVSPNKAYASTYGGVFKSVDGGNTWTRASNGIVATTAYGLPLMMDKEQPSKLYTFDSWARLYRTDDGGNTWAILPDALPDGVHPASFADKPGFGCVFVIGTATQSPGIGSLLFKSSDCGLHFQQIGNGLPADVAITSVSYDPSDPGHNRLIVGLDGDSGSEGNAIYRSTDAGLTFMATSSNFTPGSGYRLEVTQVSYAPDGQIWAVVGSYYIFHSNDGGLTWTNTGATGANSVVADPVVSGKAWIGSVDAAYSIQFDGSLYQINEVATGLTANPSYDDGTRPVPAGVARLAWRPGASPKLFATTQGSGIFGLTDGATPTWSPVTAAPAGAGVHAVAIHPGTPQRLWAGQATFSISSPAVFTSTDGGLSWAPANNGLEAADIEALVIDPGTTASVATTTLYAGGRSANSFSDDFKNNGIYRSDDGGQNWDTLDGGLPATANRYLGTVNSIALDPQSCASPPCVAGGGGSLNRLYVAGSGSASQAGGPQDDTHRLLRSDDRGGNWDRLDDNTGFPRSNFVGTVLQQRVTPTVVAVDAQDPQVVYVGTESEFRDDDTGDAFPLDPARESGLFRSVNGGATWARIAGLPGKIDTALYPNASRDVVDLLVDPDDGDVLWIALRDRDHSATSTILRSGNAGASWQPADDGLNSSLEIRDLAFDPANTDVLYATVGGNGANPGAVYRGFWNAGTQSITWLSISVGLPAESAYAIAVDPTNPAKLHAGTDTGVHSITRQPDQDGDGIPDAVENQAPDVPGGLNGPGDGNGDGQLDSAQRDVGSTVIIIRRDANGSAVAGGGDAVTSTIGQRVGPGATPCAQAVDVAHVDASLLSIDIDPASKLRYEHPTAARQFEITNCTSATVDITYHGVPFTGRGWTFRFFGPAQSGNADAFGWFPLTDATYLPPSTWRVPLAAAGLGNYRPEADAIRFVGAPACLDDRLMSDGFETAPDTVAWCND